MRALLRAAGAILTIGASLSCDSSTQIVTSPSTLSKCQVTASAEPATFAAGGGGGSLTITTTRDCQWSATTSGNWIQLGEPASGQGSGTVSFSVTTNPNPSQRRGAIAITDQQITISQEAAPCVFSVSPITDSVSPDGERRTVRVTASHQQCTWSARSESEWLAIVEGSQGSGNGQVIYEARRTSGPSRRGELTIAGQRVTVTQATGCRFDINPQSASFASGGGSGSVAVTTDESCEWTAASNVAWVTIAAGSRSGNGAAQFTVAANNSPARSGTISVAGRTFTVSQSSGCSFGINPTSATVGDGGGTTSVAVNTGAGCGWAAASPVSWVHVSAGQTGSGPGTVSFVVSSTPTSLPRAATMTVAGQTFTINQNGAPCLYVVSPPSVGFDAGGGSGTFEVNTPEACAWSAASNDGWLRVTGGSSGSGDGTVSFAADPNQDAPRIGVIIAGGRTFTVSQAGR
jgi:hypothetical protein